jgi:hypothetical protein
MGTVERKIRGLPGDGCNWFASGWPMPFAIALLFFKTTPVLKVFSSDPDGMPLFEAWWLKSLQAFDLPVESIGFLYKFGNSPCPKVCHPFPKKLLRARCQVGKPYA